MSGRSSQKKGKVGEKGAADQMRGWGIPVQITARAQAGTGRSADCADLRFGLGHKYHAEVKFWKTGFKKVYDSLGSQDLLVLKQNNLPRVYVMSAAFAAEVLGAWHERMCEVEGGGR